MITAFSFAPHPTTPTRAVVAHSIMMRGYQGLNLNGATIRDVVSKAKMHPQIACGIVFEVWPHTGIFMRLHLSGVFDCVCRLCTLVATSNTAESFIQTRDCPFFSPRALLQIVGAISSLPAIRFFDESVKFHNPKDPALKTEYCPCAMFCVLLPMQFH
jgi:hypothetical protein